MLRACLGLSGPRDAGVITRSLEGGALLGQGDEWLITRSLLRARIHPDVRDVCDGSDPSDIPPFAVKAS